MKPKSVFRKAFGLDEHGFVALPSKFSNVQIARLEFGNKRGCSWCFPHGWETDNSTVGKNRKNWKNHRKTQYRSK